MKPFQPVFITRLLLLLVLMAFLPASGYTSVISDVISDFWNWHGWIEGSQSKSVTDSFSRILFTGKQATIQYKYEGFSTETEPDIVPLKAPLKQNQIYMNWAVQKGDTFNLCFRKASGASPEECARIPAVKVSSVENDVSTFYHANTAIPTISPGGLCQYTASFQLSDKGTGTLSIEGNNDWKIAPDCGGISSASTEGGILSDGASVELLALTDLILKKQDEDTSVDHAPGSIPFFSEKPKSPDDSERLTGSGGGGSYDDNDDPFNKKPGDAGQKPLAFFELMSKWVGMSVIVPNAQGQPQSDPTLVLRPQIVLVVYRGWSRQEILISPKTWGLVERTGRSNDPDLLLALADNPNDPNKTIENYLNENTEMTDYRRYQREELFLNPKLINAQLQSVSVFPGTCPSGVGCSGGEHDANQVMKQLSLSDQVNPAQRSTASNLAFKIFENNEDDDDGLEKNNNKICQVCKVRNAFYDGKCETCLESEDELARRESSVHISFPEVRESDEVKVSKPEQMNGGALAVSRWMQNIYRNDEPKMFHPVSYYRKPQLYQLLSKTVTSNRKVLLEFTVEWERFLKGDYPLRQFILSIARLAASNGIDSDLEIYRIVTALATYREEFETAESLEQFSENRLYKELNRMNVLNEEKMRFNEYRSVGDTTKAQLVDFIFNKIGYVIITMQHTTVPSEFDTINALNLFAFKVSSRYGFGSPATDTGTLSITPWGLRGYPQTSFITRENEQLLKNRGSEQTLEGLVSSICELDPTREEDNRREGDNKRRHTATMLTALAILKPILSREFNELFKGLSGRQLEVLDQWGQSAVRELMQILNKNPEQKEDFRHYMYMIFGKVPRELEASTATYAAGASGSGQMKKPSQPQPKFNIMKKGQGTNTGSKFNVNLGEGFQGNVLFGGHNYIDMTNPQKKNKPH